MKDRSRIQNTPLILRLIFLLLLLILLLPVPGIAGGDRVTIYTHNDIREMEELVPMAEAATGLNIAFVRLSSSQILARLEAEAPRFGADMVWGILNSDAIHAKSKGFLEKHVSPAWQGVPDQFRDGEGFWCGWSYWYNTLLVNTRILEKKNLPMPRSWADLLNPCYKGEIVASNPGTSGTAFLVLSSLLQHYGEDAGWTYFENLDKNIAQYTKSGSAPAQMVAMGEYGLGITWDRAADLKKQAGFPVAEVIPSEGVGFDLDSIVLLKGAKHAEAARKLADWIVSPQGQADCAKVRSRVVLGNGTKVMPTFFPYDAGGAAQAKARLMDQWKERFR